MNSHQSSQVGWLDVDVLQRADESASLQKVLNVNAASVPLTVMVKNKTIVSCICGNSIKHIRHALNVVCAWSNSVAERETVSASSIRRYED